MALFDTPSDSPAQEEIPPYLQGADLHNIGNTGQSWFDPSTYGDRLANGFKFSAAAIISGADQIYNSAVAIGNAAGASLEEVDTAKVLGNIDSDLGEYYTKNREGIDLGGFLVGSLIPGIGGIKVFNAGQTLLKSGKVGANMARATGLLVPKTEAYIGMAAQEINASQATFSAISQSGIKALASGVQQNVLESIAFETAVQATMFKSPVLDNQSAGDVIANIALGGLVGGVVGGVITGVGTVGAISKQVKQFEREGKFASARALQQELNSPSLNVIRNAQDLEQSAMLRPPLPTATPEEQALYEKLRSDAASRASRIQLDIRTDINALNKGDDKLVSNMLADVQFGTGAQDTLDTYLHAAEIGRAGVASSVEREANRLAKEAIDKGLVPELEHLQISHMKLTGEGAGEVLDGELKVLRIADRVAQHSGESLESAVLGEVKSHGFKLTKSWDAAKMAGKLSHFEAEARYIWADRLEKLPDAGEFWAHKGDIPLIQRAWKDGRTDIRLTDDTGQVLKNGFSSREEMFQYLREVKTDIAGGFLEKIQNKYPEYLEMNAEMAAKIVDTKLARLSGTHVDDTKDFLATQTAGAELTALKKAKGLIKPGTEDLNAHFLPSYAKISRVLPDEFLPSNQGHLVDAMAWIKTKEIAAQSAMDNVVAKHAGDLSELLFVIPEQSLHEANKIGGSARLFSYANGGYGSVGSMFQAMGSAVQKIKQKFRGDTATQFEGVLTSLGKNQDAVVEFNAMNQRVTRSGEQWVRHTEGDVEHLITKSNKAALENKTNPAEFEDLAPEGVIELTNPEVASAVDAMISRSGTRTEAYTELRAAQGKTDTKDPAVYRPIRPNPTDYKHFAFVKDDKVTGQGHTTMLFAATPEKLAELASKAEREGFRVHFKSDTEDFKRAYGDYEYARTLNESYLDSSLKNKGVYSEHFTKSDPQKTINDILNQHLREDDVLAMELARGKNQKAFDFLEDQGKAYSKIESSKFGGSLQSIEASGKNPYLDYLKTGLDISKTQTSMLYGFNKMLDSAVSRAVASIREMPSRSPADLEEINKSLARHGINTAYGSAAEEMLVNHSAPKGELTKFVRAANAVLSKLTLGLDPLNALNNGIGANILRGTELTQLNRAIASGDKEIAGKLASLGKVTLPGTGDQITAPSKMIAKAMQNFFKDGKDGPLHQRYREAGYIKDLTTQFHDIIDDFTLKGTETVQDLNSRINRAIAKADSLSKTGEKLTGNAFAEEFNRFISADVMRMHTDVAESKGLLSRAESHSYINTFVNRVEGNTIASQRPLVFQGPIGQAVGLFQSYQFNLMQQLFRYSAEGTAKDATMLLGLQGTFYGMNGLPGFQFFNQHVIGTMSGNPKHIDAYDALYGGAGKQMGDLLMYGLPSNLLSVNLYSRGDINPRQVTILPTSLPDVPFVGALGKLFVSVKDTTTKIAGGGAVWESMLQGLEHNGLSRPLAGIAQSLQALGPGGQAYSTTSKGSILFSNDLASWATMTRIAGGRPLDEAIINDGVFRIHAYQQADRARQQSLASTIKTTGIQGNAPDEDQTIKFAKAYAEAGGKQVNFNKFMLGQMKAANTNEATKITSQLQNPFAQKVQLLMGGAQASEF
jgi:uncharacterized protein YukE